LSTLEDYFRLEEVLQQYFDTYPISLEATLENEGTTFPPCYRMLVHQLHVEYQLGRSADMESRAQQFLEFSYNFHLNNPNLNEYHYRDFEASKNGVENVIYRIREADNLAKRISYYQDMAQKYPHEAQPQYVLMQLYNEKSDYKAMNAAAQQYLKNKPAFIINSFDRAKTLYLILKSHYYMKDYRDGLHLFQTNDKWVHSVMDPDDYVLWLKFGIQLFTESNDINAVTQYIDLFHRIYTQCGWTYDDDVESVKLAEARVNYKSGNLKKAHRLLDEILVYSDHDPLADVYKQTWKKPGFFSGFKF